jgi:ornithine cyclodeaminase/alanine dehydrogenase-like protein (mu-crystallin family)
VQTTAKGPRIPAKIFCVSDMTTSATTLTEADVRRMLDPRALIEAIENAFRNRYDSLTIPPRTRLELADSMFLTMSCYDASANALGTKLISVRKNPAPGEERVHATYLLLEAQTAHPRRIIGANYLTAARTAATSAVATKFLARSECSTLGIFGTGRLARAHLEFLPLVRKFDRVLICGRDVTRSQAFVRQCSPQTNIQLKAADARTCAAESDVICTCTTSDTPLFDGSLLAPGTHLNLTGTFQPHAREVDNIAVRRSRVFVDTREGAMSEAGDVIVPIHRGEITPAHIIGDLHELLSRPGTGRVTSADITIFKSVGCAVEDLVAAELLLSSELNVY